MNEPQLKVVANDPSLQEDLPPDLIQKVASIKLLATTHNILRNQACYPYSVGKIVEPCIDFISELYNLSLEEALERPDADQHEFLRGIKAARSDKVRSNELQLAAERKRSKKVVKREVVKAAVKKKVKK